MWSVQESNERVEFIKVVLPLLVQPQSDNTCEDARIVNSIEMARASTIVSPQ